MIHEIQQSKNITLTMDCGFPEARAVLDGNNPGWVFVDKPDLPGAALVWAQGIEGFYLIGDANCAVFQNELDRFTDHALKPRLKELGITWLEISGDETWDAVIEKVYQGRSLEISQQYVYTLPADTRPEYFQRKPVIAPEIKRIDRELFGDLEIMSREFLFSKLNKFWGDAEAFMRGGFGYVLLVNEEIISLCFSGFVAGNMHVIDIETKAAHQKKGYAEKVAQAYIADCIDRRFQPYWDCMVENIASARLAEKLGFKKSHLYTLYSLPL